MVNKNNNSKIIEEKIKEAARERGLSSDTFKRFATMEYLKKEVEAIK